jgi:hypothetical protein
VTLVNHTNQPVTRAYISSLSAIRKAIDKKIC